MPDLQVELSGSKDFGPCDCCGQNSRTVWGYIYRDGEPSAAYFVHWTLGRVEQDGAHFDFVVGAWGDAAAAADRQAVSLVYRSGQGGGFMIIDAASRRTAGSRLAGRALARKDVVGTALASEVFQLVDAVWLEDSRLAEITGLHG
jgi:hypothetical protein